MKKIYLITALLLAFVFVFTACEVTDNESNASVSQNESGDGQTSAPQESVPQGSEPEVSEPGVSDEVSQPYREDVTLGVVEGDAYTQEQLDEWVQEYITKYKNVTSSVYGENTKYNVMFFPELGAIAEHHFVDSYLTNEKVEEYKKLFWGTESYNLAELLEYYSISWDEYIGFYVGNEYDRIMCLGKHADSLGTGQVPDGIPPYASCPQFFNSGWGKEEFWNHEDFILDSYAPGEFEDYYTSVPDRIYTRRAYIIDGKFIERVGWEAFSKWLDETEDKDQTVWNFVEYFGVGFITTTDGGPWKYRSLGLTEEDRELYFTVHPLEK